MKRRIDHGPRCIACTDPAEAARQIAIRRARLDEEAEVARASRAHSNEVRDRWLYQRDLSREDFIAVQTVVIEAARVSNLLWQGVLMERAHLERVETAHGLAPAEATS